MTRLRIALVAMMVALAVGATVATTAIAAPGGRAKATSPGTLYTFPIKGVAKNGKKFHGTFGIQRLVVATVHGKRAVYAVGTLKGTLAGHHVTRNHVMAPVNPSFVGGSSSGSTSGSTTSTRQATPASCPILHLVLGPINLNLLGLQVQLGGGPAADQVIVLNLTAHQGGGLLGDLLCGVSNALGTTGLLSQLNSELQSLSATLTSILGSL